MEKTRNEMSNSVKRGKFKIKPLKITEEEDKELTLMIKKERDRELMQEYLEESDNGKL